MKLKVKNKNDILIITSIAFGFGMYIVIFITFLFALTNGHQCNIYINQYGEAVIETIMLIIIGIIMIIGFLCYYRKTKNE